jgi:hypothetical protein
MSTPWVPPYFGSWEEIVQSLLHNPFLGSPHPSPHLLMSAGEAVALNPQPLPPGGGPVPDPWRNAAVRYLATLVSMEEQARVTENQQLREQLTTGAERALSAFIDDFCGSSPRRIPWPWPGPPPWVSLLASHLVAAANTQNGQFREGLMRIAARIGESALPTAKAVGTRAA